MLSSMMTDTKVGQNEAVWCGGKARLSLQPSPKAGLVPQPKNDGKKDAEELQDCFQEATEGVLAAKGAAADTVVRQQLGRILQSRSFVQSEKLSRFLRFVVEHVLTGDSACLKEYLVGVEVYDRKPPYDPSQDSIVRTEARRLRNKLKEYYGADGKDDPIYIYLRPGSYVPTFYSRAEWASATSYVASRARLPDSATPLVIAVLPFEDISREPLSSRFSRGVPDELAYRLMLADGCGVVSPSLTARLTAEGLDLACIMRKVGAQLAFQGSVRVAGSRLRIIASIVTPTGAQLWSNRVDSAADAEPSFVIEEEVAKALADGWDAVRRELPLTPSRGGAARDLAVARD